MLDDAIEAHHLEIEACAAAISDPVRRTITNFYWNVRLAPILKLVGLVG